MANERKDERTSERKGGERREAEERIEKRRSADADADAEKREDEGYGQPESSAQKMPERP